jgi:leucine dehydrogenase
VRECDRFFGHYRQPQGYELAKRLHQTGAKLLVSDIDAERVKKLVDDFGATTVAADQILGAHADILAPCALGGVINDKTILQLKVEIIVGSANNQLLEDRHGDALHEIGIIYVPDYVANAGGVIHRCRELGSTEKQTKQRIHGIYDMVTNIFDSAGSRTASFRVANQLAERKLFPN